MKNPNKIKKKMESDRPSSKDGVPCHQAGGFTSVSDMIHVKGAENVCNYKRETRASLRKQVASAEKPGKENLLDRKTDPNAGPVKENPTKKRKGVKVMQDDTGVSDKALDAKKQKNSKLKASKEIAGGNVNEEKNENSSESVIPLPTGSELVTIAGVDLPKEDAGNALQLLEFCYTFGKIVGVSTGQAQSALKDLIKGRSARRGKFTSLVQLHIQLLSVIQNISESESELESSDSNDDDSWLKALKSCISTSRMKQLDCIDTTAAGYDNLDFSTKLGLLIFLCDEVLGTEKIRIWIDEENAKFGEKKKEAKGKLCAAKLKEKSLKQKIQDEVAKAITANYGVPITTKEHDEIVSRIKNKEAEAHADMLECKTTGLEEKEKADAVRTEPIFKDNKGHMYWRIKGCSDNPGVLLQDIGTGDHMVAKVDKWFEFDDEQKNLIEGHINLLRSRLKNYYKN